MDLLYFFCRYSLANFSEGDDHDAQQRVLSEDRNKLADGILHPLDLISHGAGDVENNGDEGGRGLHRTIHYRYAIVNSTRCLLLLFLLLGERGHEDDGFTTRSLHLNSFDGLMFQVQRGYRRLRVANDPLDLVSQRL